MKTERTGGGAPAARPRGPLGASPAAEEAETRWRQWMIAAQAGDGASYEKLLGELAPVARRQVRSRIREGALVEDVVQNSLLSLHRARHTYRPERRFTPWLRAIVRNATIDALRDLRRRGDREVGVEHADLLPDRAERGPWEAGDGQRPLPPALTRALESLPGRQREAVVMIQLEGLSVAEAAARAGVSANALKVRAHRGYKALRALLATGDRE